MIAKFGVILIGLSTMYIAVNAELPFYLEMFSPSTKQ